MRPKRWDETDEEYSDATRQYWWHRVFPAHCVWWLVYALIAYLVYS